ncbi:MAG TPA: prepilin-type N-terminal cleavage/methylation domain-containing protein [Lachnospiraceae bacterium]|nr:prepilin-type N-terminal cleavage/methylation domain-containing protein [Lachnospiraceae bacterium]
MRNGNAYNRGFTLVEVIVSMAILAIVAVPLLSYFISSAQYNERAKGRQEALVLAESILEQCKDESMAQIAKGFHCEGDPFLHEFKLVDPSNIINPTEASRPDRMVSEVKADGTPIAKNSSDGSYQSGEFTASKATDGILYYAIRNIRQDGRNYDALIRFDTCNSVGDPYYNANNIDKLYRINSINSPVNIVGVESVQYERALTYMINSNAAEYSRQIAAKVSPAPVALSESAVEAAMRREMVIEVNETADSSKAKFRIYYQYYCDSIPGCPNQTNAVMIDPPLYNETVTFSTVRNLYLFFNRSNPSSEKVIFHIDTDLKDLLAPFDFYLLCQADASDHVPSCNVDIQVDPSFHKINQIYSNVNMVSRNAGGIDTKSPDGYVTSSTSLRMLTVTVDIYEAGGLLNPDAFITTLESTKGE